MRECDRCGKKIQYGTLCHDCNIYLTSFCQGEREGRRLGKADGIDICIALFKEYQPRLATHVSEFGDRLEQLKEQEGAENA